MRIKCFMMACLLVFSISGLCSCNKSSGVEDSATKATASEIPDSEKTMVTIPSLEYDYESIDELYESADLIIKGKAIDSTVELMSHKREQNPDDPKFITTVCNVEISEVYKGKAGDTTTLLQLGGETEDTIYICESAADIELNKEYIMFVTWGYDNTVWLLNSYQAIYAVEGEELSSLSPDFGSGYDNLLDFLQSKQS